MPPSGLDSYLICATPRSGSTLLCGLLESSGVAGHPASYFNRKSLDDYARAWNIARPEDGGIDHVFVEAALNAGRTSNGVFGGRVMGESWPELLGGLAEEDTESSLNDAELLEAAFGRLGFVHLHRGDSVAQAVSWAKSLQTHFWHPGEVVEPGGEQPHYDEDLIGRLVTTITNFETAWTQWFATQGVQPHEVTYEELAADPAGVAHRVLDGLGLEVPNGRALQVRHLRQADQTNTEWVNRFRLRIRSRRLEDRSGR